MTTTKRARLLGALLTSALFLATCAGQEPFALLTGSGECYDGWSGDLAFDAVTNSVTFDVGSRPKPVQWPPGYTGRRSGQAVEILDRDGRVLYRTGTRVTLLGDGYQDKVFKVCGLELIP